MVLRGKLGIWLTSLAALSACVFAAQPAPTPPPNSPESLLIDRIQAISDPAERIPLLVEFTERFAQSPSAHWAWENLQSAYLDRSDFTQLLDTGQRMMELYPADVDAAANCLRAARELKLAELIRQYAVETWRRAAVIAATRAPEAEYARQVQSNAEFALATLARDPDPQTSESARRSLARLNPAYERQPDEGGADRVAEPLNLETQLKEAEKDLWAGRNLEGVLAESQRAAERLGSDPAADQYRAAARWLAGVAASYLGRYALADYQLRQALPYLRNTPEALETALYHLGFANYWLAEMGERERIFDALKFNRQCAAMKGRYRPIAEQTVASIRSQYNMR
ncbi:MAG: hypothetical protein JSU00_22550 [Acidobacteria bacterium]|nr:hypothetical protein [Acidobacteriota bacterium]